MVIVCYLEQCVGTLNSSKVVIGLTNKKSAKDIAFDRERTKLRSEIKRLNNLVTGYKETVSSLLEVTNSQTHVIQEQNEIIADLLSYLDLDKNELHILVDKEKSEYEYRKRMLSTFEFMSLLSSKF